MRIGIVDLDTSHPPSWIPIEREMGHEILGVWDGGSVHPAGYAERFAQEHGIPRVYRSLEEMAQDVDCAIIHGCDWDTHIAKATPFVQAGRAVLVDKPLAGNLRDLQQIVRWAQEGVRVTGGSSLRFCYEVQRWLAQPVEERGTPDTVVCGCAVDEFNYGIHAYSLLAGIMGGGAHSVQHIGKGVLRRVVIRWQDGRMGIVIVGTAERWMPFYATVVTEKGVTQFQADTSQLYRALLEATLPYLAGERDTPPVPAHQLVEPELWAIAARQSWLEDDREVLLSEISEQVRYDGSAFAQEYRRMKYPQS
ncbi:MAG: Gfo/Idh/MocA family oxidoreductase [Armatimonadota bacterium]